MLHYLAMKIREKKSANKLHSEVGVGVGAREVERYTLFLLAMLFSAHALMLLSEIHISQNIGLTLPEKRCLKC